MNSSSKNVQTNGNTSQKVVKKEDNQLRVFTGTVDKVIHWAPIQDRVQVLFEIVANLVSIQQGTHATQKILIIQDEKNARCMKIIYYEIGQSLPTLQIGSVVKCIGKFISRDVLHAFKIMASSISEKSDVQRIAFICEFAIQELLKSKA